MSLSLDELCQNGFHQGWILSSSMCKEVRTKWASNLSVPLGTNQTLIIWWYKYRNVFPAHPAHRAAARAGEAMIYVMLPTCWASTGSPISSRLFPGHWTAFPAESHVCFRGSSSREHPAFRWREVGQGVASLKHLHPFSHGGEDKIQSYLQGSAI